MMGDIIETIKKILTHEPGEDATINLFGELVNKADASMTAFLVEQVTKTTQILIEFLLSTPLSVMRSQQFQDVYWTVSKLSLSSLLPVLGYFGLKVIRGDVRTEDISRTFWRIMLMPLFITLAPFAVMKLISTINEISQTLLNSEAMAGGYVPEHLDIITLLVIVSYLFLMFKLILYYAMRNFFLMAHVAISPVFYLIWSMPGRYDKFNKWCQEIGTLLLTQLIHIIELLLLLSITKVNNNSLDGLVMQVGALIVMNKTPNWVGEYLDSSLQLPNVRAGKYLRYLKNPGQIAKGFKNVFK